jgi:hypothetical protein
MPIELTDLVPHVRRLVESTGRDASFLSDDRIGRALLEAGFTGTKTDSLGRKVRFVNGRRVAGHGVQGRGTQAARKAKRSGSPSMPMRQASGKKGLARRAVGAAAKVASAPGKAEEWLHRKIASGLDKMPGPVGNNIRRLWNLSSVAFTGAYDAVEAYGKELGKSPENAKRIAALLSTADVIIAKAATVANIAAPVAAALMPGANVAEFVPVASVAYLGLSAFRHPVKVMRAAHAAIRNLPDRLKSPGKYKATAMAAHESKDGFQMDRESAKRLWDRLDGFGQDKRQREWYTALLYAALDWTRGDVPAALDLADAALDAKPVAEAMAQVDSDEAADRLRLLIEGCIPNEKGPGHHDSKTGHPCSTGSGAVPAAAPTKKIGPVTSGVTVQAVGKLDKDIEAGRAGGRHIQSLLDRVKLHSMQELHGILASLGFSSKPKNKADAVAMIRWKLEWTLKTRDKMREIDRIVETGVRNARASGA